LWQLIFVIWVLALFSNAVLSDAVALSGSDQVFLALCALMFVSLIYLSASVKQEFAKRGWSWSAWMGWK
jgi:hypothetical protein